MKPFKKMAVVGDLRIITSSQYEASALEQPYEASTPRLLNPLKVLFGDGLNAMEVHSIGLGTEQAIGHTTVNMRVQRRTEAMKSIRWVLILGEFFESQF